MTANPDEQQVEDLWRVYRRIEKATQEFRDVLVQLNWRFVSLNFENDHTAFCLGNGESRRGMDLDALRERGVVFGCNALYRDWVPDVLVSVDQPMIKEIRRAKPNCVFFWSDLGQGLLRTEATVPPVTYPNYASGPSSILIACMMLQNTLQRVFLVGHDFFGKGSTINNMYKGTKHYRPRGHPPVSPDAWLVQIAEIIEANADVTFYRCGPPARGATPLLERLPNLRFISYEEMWEITQ